MSYFMILGLSLTALLPKEHDRRAKVLFRLLWGGTQRVPGRPQQAEESIYGEGCTFPKPLCLSPSNIAHPMPENEHFYIILTTIIPHLLYNMRAQTIEIHIGR
jgi:hypothetical protein